MIHSWAQFGHDSFGQSLVLTVLDTVWSWHFWTDVSQDSFGHSLVVTVLDSLVIAGHNVGHSLVMIQYWAQFGHDSVLNTIWSWHNPECRLFTIPSWTNCGHDQFWPQFWSRYNGTQFVRDTVVDTGWLGHSIISQFGHDFFGYSFVMIFLGRLITIMPRTVSSLKKKKSLENSLVKIPSQGFSQRLKFSFSLFTPQLTC